MDHKGMVESKPLGFETAVRKSLFSKVAAVSSLLRSMITTTLG